MGHSLKRLQNALRTAPETFLQKITKEITDTLETAPDDVIPGYFDDVAMVLAEYSGSQTYLDFGDIEKFSIFVAQANWSAAHPQFKGMVHLIVEAMRLSNLKFHNQKGLTKIFATRLQLLGIPIHGPLSTCLETGHFPGMAYMVDSDNPNGYLAISTMEK